MKKIFLITLILILLTPQQASADRIWQGGAELNSTTDEMEQTLNSGSVSIVTTPVRSGTYAYRTNTSASTGFWRHHVFSSNQSSIGYLSVAVRIATAPGGTIQLIRFSNTSNAHVASLRLNSDRTVGLYAANNSQVGSNSSALSLNTWYVLELKLDGSGTTNALEGKLDGTSFASGNNSTTGSWARILWGAIAGNNTSDIYYDDIKLNTSSGSNQTGYPGLGQLIRLKPNASGDNNEWKDTAGSAGTTSNYTLVDEVTPNDATDYIQSTTANDDDFYNVEASGLDNGDTIYAVTVSGRQTNNTADATTAIKYGIKKTSAGTLAQGSSIIPNSTTWRTDTGTVQIPTLVTYADPDASAWTNSTLDSMQIGVSITGDGANSILVSGIWAYVDYLDGAPTSSRRIIIVD